MITGRPILRRVGSASSDHRPGACGGRELEEHRRSTTHDRDWRPETAPNAPQRQGRIMNVTKRASIAAAALITLTLVGCAGTPDSAPSEQERATVTSVEEVAEPAITAAPEPTGPEATYLVEVRKRTDVATITQAADEQLLAAGHMACDTFPSNPDIEALRLIGGEHPRDDGRYFDSVVIGTHAAMFLCPEFDPR